MYDNYNIKRGEKKMTYGKRKVNRKLLKSVRLKENDCKKLDIVCIAYGKKPQEILEKAIVDYLNKLEEAYVEKVMFGDPEQIIKGKEGLNEKRL